jgi:hypothetical protein
VSISDVNRFDQREWVNDIATGVMTGLACGAVGTMLLPDPAFRDAMVSGGILGLIGGLLLQPLKWVLNRRPAADPPPRPEQEESSHETSG